MALTKPLTLTFADDGAVPNNPLPALVYKGAVDLGADPEGELERLFTQNGWGAFVPSADATVIDCGCGEALHADLVATGPQRLILCELAPSTQGHL